MSIFASSYALYSQDSGLHAFYVILNILITGAAYCAPTIIYRLIKKGNINKKNAERFVLISCIIVWLGFVLLSAVNGEVNRSGAVFFWYFIAREIMRPTIKKSNGGTIIASERPIIKNEESITYKLIEQESLNTTTAENVSAAFDPTKETDNTSLEKDYARYLELREELKKIPVKKIKQWYAEGRLGEEQYKASARKYNAILKEIKEIKEKIAANEENNNE